MNETKLLENIFNLTQQGITVDISNLPSYMSKDVVEKNMLYIELKNLVKHNGDPTRIAELKELLSPKEKEEDLNYGD